MESERQKKVAYSEMEKQKETIKHTQYFGTSECVALTYSPNISRVLFNISSSFNRNLNSTRRDAFAL